MAFDEEPEDERPGADPPPEPDDRLWRHPSELAGGVAPPAAWAPLPPVEHPKRSMAAAALVSACLAGAVVAVGAMWVARPTRVVVEGTTPTVTVPTSAASFAFSQVPAAGLAESLAPSLVAIHVSRKGTWSNGTGVWLDDQGTIGVASTVTDDADAIRAVDADGTDLEVTPAGTDPATGITTLKATTTSGKPWSGEAARPRPGTAVATVGAMAISPSGGYGQRVVTASLSAVGVRSTISDDTEGPVASALVIHDSIQLDRALPRDSLGAVVVDADGHLIGFVIDVSGDDRLAVVAPAGAALAAAEDLMDDGEIERGWLGVKATDLDPDRADLLGTSSGARLTEVTPGSPAATVLEVDDVIVAIDGQPVRGASDLVLALRSLEPGEVVDVAWRRGATEGSAAITLGG